MTTSVAVTIGGAVLAMLTCLGMFAFQATDRYSDRASIAAAHMDMLEMKLREVEHEAKVSYRQLQQQLSPPVRSVNRDGESFTSTTDCPKCGHLAVHWLDTPRRATEQDWADYQKALDEYDPDDVDEHRIVAWGGQAVKTSTVPRQQPPPPPPDEDWTVARVCVKCNYRWGQT